LARTSPERRDCLAVLRRWSPDGAKHLDDLISERCEEGSNRAFVQNLCYGVIRNLSLLDYWIDHLAGKGRDIDEETRAVLRAGLYELLRTRTPDHAAVNEAVNAAGRARGFVNALLRRAGREREELEALAEEASLPIKLSHPFHLVERWRSQLGEEDTGKLCLWDQEPSPVFVRVNGLRPTPPSDLTEYGEPLTGQQGFWRVEQLPRRHLNEGDVYAQDPSTIIAPRLLDPQPGDLVLDACAAPGGKAALMAEMMGNEGQIIACDPKPRRMEILADNLKRLGVTCATYLPVEWGNTHNLDLPKQGFDRILVDAPCTNTGVLRRRVDARWRIDSGEFARLAAVQLSILEDVAPHLSKTGSMVYSTCSLDQEENQGVVKAFLKRNRGWVLEDERQSLPFRHGFDGAYAALLKRG